MSAKATASSTAKRRGGPRDSRGVPAHVPLHGGDGGEKVRHRDSTGGAHVASPPAAGTERKRVPFDPSTPESLGSTGLPCSIHPPISPCSPSPISPSSPSRSPTRVSALCVLSGGYVMVMQKWMSTPCCAACISLYSFGVHSCLVLIRWPLVHCVWQ